MTLILASVFEGGLLFFSDRMAVKEKQLGSLQKVLYHKGLAISLGGMRTDPFTLKNQIQKEFVFDKENPQKTLENVLRTLQKRRKERIKKLTALVAHTLPEKYLFGFVSGSHSYLYEVSSDVLYPKRVSCGSIGAYLKMGPNHYTEEAVLSEKIISKKLKKAFLANLQTSWIPYYKIDKFRIDSKNCTMSSFEYRKDPYNW